MNYIIYFDINFEVHNPDGELIFDGKVTNDQINDENIGKGRKEILSRDITKDNLEEIVKINNEIQDLINLKRAQGFKYLTEEIALKVLSSEIPEAVNLK